jgi:carbonic anhydrase
VKKLIRGIVQFRKNVRDGYQEAFGRLALGQSPDTLFIACSDSRVVPNTFASTDPGDLFVHRNVGNLIPPCGGNHGLSVNDLSEAAAVEFSVLLLAVSSIVVCGHSECGAMKAILAGRESLDLPNLRDWLQHGEPALKNLQSGKSLSPELTPANQLSQLNVLSQMEHVKSYPAVQKRIQEGKLQVHGWWFDIAKADVYAFEEEMNQFVLIDEQEADRIIRRLEKTGQTSFSLS